MTDNIKLTAEEQQLVLAHRAKTQRAAGYQAGYRQGIKEAAAIVENLARIAEVNDDDVIRDQFVMATQLIFEQYDAAVEERS